MLVGADASIMLLTNKRFVDCSKHPLKEVHGISNVLYAIGVESREAVGVTTMRALDQGASFAGDPKDHGYLCARSFRDPDGHHFELFWVDPTPFSPLRDWLSWRRPSDSTAL
jgi:uncharacterized protein